MAPVLDGEKRGWGVPVTEVYEDEYDDEEEIQEELEQPGVGGGGGEDLTAEEQWRDSGMYKSTNSFLHDLHALHQHRLIASSSSTPSSPSPLSQQQQSSLSSSSLPSSSSQYIPPSYNNMLTKSTLPPLSERLCIPSFDHDLIAQRGLDGHAVGDMMPLGEERMVKERYEDTNRYILSSTFFMLSLLMKAFLIGC
jgi:hypothetical protein